MFSPLLSMRRTVLPNMSHRNSRRFWIALKAGGEVESLFRFKREGQGLLREKRLQNISALHALFNEAVQRPKHVNPFFRIASLVNALADRRADGDCATCKGRPAPFGWQSWPSPAPGRGCFGPFSMQAAHFVPRSRQQYLTVNCLIDTAARGNACTLNDFVTGNEHDFIKEV